MYIFRCANIKPTGHSCIKIKHACDISWQSFYYKPIPFTRPQSEGPNHCPRPNHCPPTSECRAFRRSRPSKSVRQICCPTNSFWCKLEQRMPKICQHWCTSAIHWYHNKGHTWLSISCQVTMTSAAYQLHHRCYTNTCVCMFHILVYPTHFTRDRCGWMDKQGLTHTVNTYC
jgi:hypothetical protein